MAVIATLPMRVLTGVLNTIVPTPPVTLDDVVAVWGMLRPHVAAPFKLDVQLEVGEIHVRIYFGAEVVYERTLRAA